MPDLAQFTASPESRTAVYAILEAHLTYERAKGARQFWVHLLAAIGSLLAISILSPLTGLAHAQNVLLALWGACGVCVLIAGVLEWKWHRREARLLATNQETGHHQRGTAGRGDR